MKDDPYKHLAVGTPRFKKLIILSNSKDDNDFAWACRLEKFAIKLEKENIRLKKQLKAIKGIR